ncbi:MAG TPA: PHB depolymerase family esterase [Paludibacteraceae bacterium]|nr:PHB depolymerase family esterase [Paludibacteraceae bacterium]HPL94142.1 PHB depolymerase family esterase [Paludibacteraceae bacterium]
MKLRCVRYTLFLFFFLVFTACGSLVVKKQEKISLYTHTTLIDGQNRFYKVYVPSHIKNNQTIPLVIALHGNGGNAEALIRETKWHTKASSEGFLVVAPEASRPNPNKPRNQRDNRQTWNDGSGRFHSGERSIDDVKFITTMINELKNTYNIDKNKIFVTGFSNGASMTFRLGMELDCIKAIAPVAGVNWIKNNTSNRKISLLYIIGAQDRAKPLEGGITKTANGIVLEKTPKPPIYENIKRWATFIDCIGEPTTFTLAQGVSGLRFTDCSSNTSIEYIIVDDLGHIWPGARQIIPKSIVGNASEKLNATEYIWNFFNTAK